MQLTNLSNWSIAQYISRVWLVLLWLVSGMAVIPTFAAEDFYKGKVVTIFIDGVDVYEGYARLLAEYMPKYIPGQPTIIVKQMLGASGLRLANYIYNVAPKDGTEIAGVHAQIPTQPLFSRQGVQYEPTAMSWIGNLTRENYVEYVWHLSPVQTVEEGRAKEAIIGGQAPGSMSVDTAILSNAIIGTKFKIVTGYSGLRETLLALERGEINGGVASYTEFQTTRADWLRDRKVKFLAQVGLQRSKALPDVPLLIDFIANPQDHQAMELFLARVTTGKPYVAPPGIPEDRLAILRRAFDSTVQDKDFITDAAAQHLAIDDPMSGAELQAFIRKASTTPPEAVQRINDAFTEYKATR